MYPSDYGYAVGGDVRDACLALNLWYYATNNCYANDWLLFTEKDQWVLTHSSDEKYVAFMITNAGSCSNYGEFAAGIAVGEKANISNKLKAVRPVLYLNSDIEITSGDGTKENPFELRIK